MDLKKISRRDFLKITGMTGAGLVISFPWRAAASSAAEAVSLNAFIAIDGSKGVQLVIPAPEIGQGIRTTLAMILADEMEADLDKVTLHQAPPDQEKYDKQVTGGSNSVRRYFKILRKAGAAAREMLVQAAADEWNIKPNSVKAENGFILNKKTSRKLSFESLAEAAAKVEVPLEPTFKKASERRYIAKPTKNLDGNEIVTGNIQFGIDAEQEGMVYAVCVRPPVRDAKLKSFDDKEAMTVPGMIAVKKFGDKIGVVANNTWVAMKAAEKLKTDWELGKNAKVDTESVEKRLARALDNPGEYAENRDNFIKNFEDAPVKLELECSVPMLAHTPLEPPNALAWVKEDSAEIWAPSQNLMQIQKNLPRMTGLPLEKITFHTMRIGGGFGRKLSDDFVDEAIQISKLMKAPVKLTFSRTDDIRHSHYRKAVSYRFRGGLDTNGKPLAMELISAGDYRKKRNPRALLGFAKSYAYGGKSVSIPLKFGPLRAPGHNANNFAYEVFVDEMAAKAGIDPLAYRLALYGDKDTVKELKWGKGPRNHKKMAEVLRAVKERSQWKSDKDYGYGIAVYEGYGSQIALVALAPKSGGKRKITQCYAVVNCGLVVNPLGAAAQIEGGIVDALGAGYHQKITLKDGRVQESNFHDYSLIRMDESPEVDVHFIDSDADPQGLGEVSYPAAQPAAVNALFAATGERKMHLPIG